MGEEVARLPRGSGVAPRPDAPDAFGAWFARERRLRAIPLEWVSQRTKIPLERLHALEAGLAPLGCDRSARATARGLAAAIGADPEEAAGRVSDSAGPTPDGVTGRVTVTPVTLPRWTPLLALALAAAGAVLGLAALLERSPSPAPDVVFRVDYVERLRASEGK